MQEVVGITTQMARLVANSLTPSPSWLNEVHVNYVMSLTAGTRLGNARGSRCRTV